MNLWQRFKQSLRVETGAGFSDGWGFKRAFEKMRVGINGLLGFPVADVERLFKWSRESDLAYACISKIVEAAQDPDLIVERRKNRKSEWETEYGHPLRQLMMRPNPEMTQADFLGVWLAGEQICGQFLCEIERNKRGKPIALWPLDPTKMTPLGEGRWRWCAGGEEIELAARDVFRSYLPDPQRPWEPLAPLQVALGAVEADAMQTMFVRAFYKNSGVPSGIIKIRGVLLGEAGKKRAEEIKLEWMRRLGLFGRHPGAPQVLDDNADYQKIGANLNELDGGNVRGQNEARICGVFGVPPLLVSAFVGLQFVNQRSSAKEALKDFWANKMSPLLKRTRTKLQWSLLLEWEEEAMVRAELVSTNWDMSQVVAMQEDIAQRDTRARESFRAGALMLSQYKGIMGLPILPGDDYYLRRANQIPITQAVIEAQIAAAVDVTARAISLVLTGSSDPNAGVDNAGGKSFQLKSYDWDGFEVWREPTALEVKADVKKTGVAMTDHAANLLLGLASVWIDLPTQAVTKMQLLAPGEYHTLALEFPLAAALELRDKIGLAFQAGANLLVNELSRQGGTGFLQRTAQAAESVSLDRLAALTTSRILNDMQARAVGLVSHLALGLAGVELWAAVAQGLLNASSAYLKKAADEAAAAAIGRGRKAAGASQTEIKIVWHYSAILDRQTCGLCAGLDGFQSENLAEMPTVPNPACADGYGKCRCLLMAEFVQE